MRSAHRSRMSQGQNSVTPPAPMRQSAPSQPAFFLRTLTPLPAPPLRLERPEREEERQGDGRGVVDEILGVDDSPAERVHVLGDREVLEDRAEAPAREFRSP